jgi:hypothetical protein
MGQYKQWLAYREQGQHLRAELLHLEQEQEQLQAEVDRLASTTDVTQNPIILALLTAQHLEQERKKPREQPEQGEQLPFAQQQESDATAPHSTDDEPSEHRQRQYEYDHEHTGYPGEDTSLLPADISAFVDAHSLTDPQIKVPWWLRNTHNPSPQEHSPVDQQSSRTDHSVERFFQRWSARTPQAPRRQQEADGRKNDPGTQH